MPSPQEGGGGHGPVPGSGNLRLGVSRPDSNGSQPAAIKGGNAPSGRSIEERPRVVRLTLDSWKELDMKTLRRGQRAD